MAVKYVKDFDFPSDWGFSGSSKGRDDPRDHPMQPGDEFGDDGTYVSRHARRKMAEGGPVRKAEGGDVSVGHKMMRRLLPRNSDGSFQYPEDKPTDPPGSLPPWARQVIPPDERIALGRNPETSGTPDWSDGRGQRLPPVDPSQDEGDGYRKGGRARMAFGGGGPGPAVPPGPAPAGRGALGAMPGGADPGVVAPVAQALNTASVTMPLPAARQALKGAAQAGRMMGSRQPMHRAPMAPSAVPQMARGGALNAAARQRLPSSDFALPGKGAGPEGKGSGSYPIPDANHAKAALSRASANASPAERATIERKVHAKYPGIGKK